MAKELLIIGPSGTGKTTSLRNLKPEETFIVNVSAKSLPFKGAGYSILTKENPTGNMFVSDSPYSIEKTMEYVSSQRPEIKHLILDDYNYTMQNEYMRRAKETSFQKFADIGSAAFAVFSKIRDLRDDLFVVVIMHSDIDTDASGKRVMKAKTVGKMVDNYLTIEGLFATVLYSEALPSPEGVKYKLRTQNDGTNTCKSPLGMFDDVYIDNDLKVVFEKMDQFYS